MGACLLHGDSGTVWELQELRTWWDIDGLSVKEKSFHVPECELRSFWAGNGDSSVPPTMEWWVLANSVCGMRFLGEMEGEIKRM